MVALDLMEAFGGIALVQYVDLAMAIPAKKNEIVVLVPSVEASSCIASGAAVARCDYMSHFTDDADRVMPRFSNEKFNTAISHCTAPG
jgi:hypothetical protein